MTSADRNNNGGGGGAMFSAQRQLFEAIFPSHIAVVSSSSDDDSGDRSEEVVVDYSSACTTTRISSSGPLEAAADGAADREEEEDVAIKKSFSCASLADSEKKSFDMTRSGSVDEAGAFAAVSDESRQKRWSATGGVFPKFRRARVGDSWSDMNRHRSASSALSPPPSSRANKAPFRSKAGRSIDQIVGRSADHFNSNNSVRRWPPPASMSRLPAYVAQSGHYYVIQERQSASGYFNAAAAVGCDVNAVVLCGAAENAAVSKMKKDELSLDVYRRFLQNRQRVDLFSAKMLMRDRVYYLLRQYYTACGLYIVGSSMNGFGQMRSDMDATLMIPQTTSNQQIDAVHVLRDVAKILSQQAWVEDQQLIPAKVPILRVQFHHPFDQVHMDLNVNNTVTIKIDHRVRPLVLIVKEWAKRQGINDASRSTLTSYSLSLMVIHFLQCGASPAVLPCLHECYPHKFHRDRDIRQLNMVELLSPPASIVFPQKNEQPVGDLFIHFLRYYAHDFDFERTVLSIRTGGILKKETVVRQSDFPNQWRCICIEEPFVLSNTAHSVYDEVVFSGIKKVFAESYRVLATNRNLEEILHNGRFSELPAIAAAESVTNDRRFASAGRTGWRRF